MMLDNSGIRIHGHILLLYVLVPLYASHKDDGFSLVSFCHYSRVLIATLRSKAGICQSDTSHFLTTILTRTHMFASKLV